MHLEMQVQETDGYLSIKAVGPYSLIDLRDLFDRVKAESEMRADRGVVLDVTEVAGTIPVMDMHVLGEHCSRVWKLQCRIAIVAQEGGLNKFFENVARNRGVQVAVVPNLGAAIAWLN
jgi:hypothetical protein